MKVWLAELRPVDLATGLEVVIRLSNTARWTSADGQAWKPALTIPLRRSVQVFDGVFQDQPQEVGSLEFALGAGLSPEMLTSYGWDGRPVKVWKGEVGQDTAAMSVMFQGFAAEASGTKKRVAVTLRGRNLQSPLLSLSYAGSGLAEGPIDLQNQPKPMLIGVAQNIEPVYVNQALGIFQYHAYGNLAGQATPTCLKVYDSGSELGTSIGDFASYAALAAAVVPGGRFATCNALGMARHGGEITGVLTIDARGAVGDGKPGNIMKYLASTIGGLVDVTGYSSADMAWLDTQLPNCPQDIWVWDQMTIEDLMRELMLTLGGYIWWTDAGVLTVGLVRTGGVASVTLDRLNIADGTRFMPTQPPIWMRKHSFARSWRVHSYSEVRTPKEINPRGTWLLGTEYSYYDLVQFDGRSWIYINDAMGSVATPGTDPDVWQLFSENGAPIYDQATAPAGPTVGALWRNSVTGLMSWFDGTVWVAIADVTAENVAQGIVGQGALATANAADFSTQVTGAEKPEDNATQTGIGSNEIRDDWFGQGWNKTAGAIQIVPSTTGGYAAGDMPYALSITPNVATQQSAVGELIPVVPAKRYFMAARVSRGTTLSAAAQLKMGGDWIGADGVTVVAAGAEAVPQTAATLAAGALPKLISWYADAPVGAAFWRPKVYVPASATPAGTVRVEGPRVTDLGYVGVVTGPSLRDFKFDFEGVLDPSNQFDAGEADLVFQVKVNGVVQTAGVTWTWTVISGSVNGKTPADGPQTTMTGTGDGTFSVTALGVDSSTVEITAQAGTAVGSANLVLTRTRAAPPTGGGGGSLTTLANQTSGFGTSGSSAYVSITGSILTGVTMPAGKTTAKVSVNLTATPANAGVDDTWDVHFKVQRLISGVWTDQMSSVTGDNTCSTSDSGPYVFPGSVGFSATITGLTAGSSYDWRVVANNTPTDFSSRVHSFSGNVAVLA